MSIFESITVVYVAIRSYSGFTRLSYYFQLHLFVGVVFYLQFIFLLPLHLTANHYQNYQSDHQQECGKECNEPCGSHLTLRQGLAVEASVDGDTTAGASSATILSTRHVK